MKRNTATIKKLRAVSEETRPGLVEELKSVNLSKYISEAVAAIVEAKLKTADIDAAVQVTQLLTFLSSTIFVDEVRNYVVRCDAVFFVCPSLPCCLA